MYTKLVGPSTFRLFGDNAKAVAVDNHLNSAFYDQRMADFHTKHAVIALGRRLILQLGESLFNWPLLSVPRSGTYVRQPGF